MRPVPVVLRPIALTDQLSARGGAGRGEEVGIFVSREFRILVVACVLSAAVVEWRVRDMRGERGRRPEYARLSLSLFPAGACRREKWTKNIPFPPTYFSKPNHYRVLMH